MKDFKDDFNSSFVFRLKIMLSTFLDLIFTTLNSLLAVIICFFVFPFAVFSKKVFKRL